MHFLVIGLSHKTASLEIREKFAFSEEKQRELLSSLLQSPEIEEALVISTCNRVEFYLSVKNIQKAQEALSSLGFDKNLYQKEGAEAVAHIFRVTAGLDSMVLGETQISGQVKDAYAFAVQCQSVGSSLNKLVHKALNVSKKIRTDTGIGRHPVSVSYAAVLLAEKIFGDLKERRVLLVGSGEMGELAAKHLLERSVGEVWIANRTWEKAQTLAQALKAQALPFAEIAQKLPEVDIVIASTGADEYLLTPSMVSGAMEKRRNNPMFFIDISVPRNIDPTIDQMENVFLYDIDHLQGLVDANLKEREREAKKAETILLTEVREFLDYVSQRELSPTIQQLSKKFDFIRRQEMEKYLSRHSGLSSEVREDWEACTKAIMNKVLHDPILLMKTEEVKGGPKYSEILKKLFRLED